MVRISKRTAQAGLGVTFAIQANAQNSTFSSSPSISSPTPTSTGVNFPPWIRPTANIQECDIFGPMCQTGSITVGLNLTSTTTTAVVPCSSYLSAQAVSLVGPYYLDEYRPRLYVDDDNWSSSFGRSPQCTSFVDIAKPGSTFTAYDKCDNSTGSLYPPNWYAPPGVIGHHMANGYTCCGPCQFDIPEIRIVYFPENGEVKTCSNRTATNSSSSTSPITPRAEPTALATFVSDGYTYTSPSIYVQVVGTARVHDSCGTQPGTLTNPTIALPPGALSTLSFEMPMGETWVGHRAFPVHTKALNLDDLACPTFGFSDEFDTTYVDNQGSTRSQYRVRTVGPPFNPLVLPPSQMLTAHPEWFCTGLVDPLDMFALSFGLWDPPVALKPVTNPVIPNKPAPTPGNGGSNPQPIITPNPRPTPAPAPSPGSPGPAQPVQSPVNPPVNPGPSNPQTPSNPGNTPSPANPVLPQPPANSPGPVNPGSPASPINPPAGPGNPVNPANPPAGPANPAITPPTNPATPANPIPSRPLSSILSSFISSGFPSNPSGNPVPNPAPAPGNVNQPPNNNFPAPNNSPGNNPAPAPGLSESPNNPSSENPAIPASASPQITPNPANNFPPPLPIDSSNTPALISSYISAILAGRPAWSTDPSAASSASAALAELSVAVSSEIASAGSSVSGLAGVGSILTSALSSATAAVGSHVRTQGASATATGAKLFEGGAKGRNGESIGLYGWLGGVVGMIGGILVM